MCRYGAITSHRQTLDRRVRHRRAGDIADRIPGVQADWAIAQARKIACPKTVLAAPPQAQTGGSQPSVSPSQASCAAQTAARPRCCLAIQPRRWVSAMTHASTQSSVGLPAAIASGAGPGWIKHRPGAISRMAEQMMELQAGVGWRRVAGSMKCPAGASSTSPDRLRVSAMCGLPPSRTAVSPRQPCRLPACSQGLSGPDWTNR